MNKKVKRLTLNRESIRCLDPTDLQAVAGGLSGKPSCATCIANCTTTTAYCEPPP
jgi:natural product precursor